MKLYFIQNLKHACNSHSLLQHATERRTLQCLERSADAVKVTAGSSLLAVSTPSPQRAQPTPVPPKGHVSDTGQISLSPPDYHCQDPNVPYTSLRDVSLVFIPWYPVTQNSYSHLQETMCSQGHILENSHPKETIFFSSLAWLPQSSFHRFWYLAHVQSSSQRCGNPASLYQMLTCMVHRWKPELILKCFP